MSHPASDYSLANVIDHFGDRRMMGIGQLSEMIVMLTVFK